jgi:chemotaxis protein CheD
VTNDPHTVLAIYGLGSCIGLAIYDPVAAVAGMLHFMLPESSLNPDKAIVNPFVFADTGIPRLLRSAYDLGAEKRRLLVGVVGGAQVVDAAGSFHVGKRNQVALRRILWKAGILIHAEDVGGTTSRSVRLEVSTGRLWVRGTGTKEHEISAKAAQPGGVKWISMP